MVFPLTLPGRGLGLWFSPSPFQGEGRGEGLRFFHRYAHGRQRRARGFQHLLALLDGQR